MRPQLSVLLLAMLFLLVFLVVGVLRMFALQGLLAQPPLAFLFAFHGKMLIFGVLAILLVAERYIGALAFKLHRSFHLMPFAVALGALLIIIGGVMAQPWLRAVGALLLAAGMAMYVALLYVVGKQSAQRLPLRFMMLGGGVLLLGAVLSLWRSPVGDMKFTLFLLGFPILTILGERVELGRFLAPGLYRRMEASFLFVLAASILLLIPGTPYLVIDWALLLALAVLPLLRGELALRHVAESGLHRYLGLHITNAYVWLFLSLLLVVAWGFAGSQALFDTAIHSLTVGFIGVMILAHAPIIAPVLLNRPIKEEKLSALPLVLLTIGNGLRVVAYLLQWAGLPLGAVVAISGLVILAALVAFIWMMFRLLSPA